MPDMIRLKFVLNSDFWDGLNAEFNLQMQQNSD